MRRRHPRVSAGRAQPVITAGQRPRPDFWHLTSQRTDHPARAADRRRPGIRSNALPRLRPSQHVAAGRPQYPRAEIGRGRDPRRAAPQHGRVATRTSPRRSNHCTHLIADPLLGAHPTPLRATIGDDTTLTVIDTRPGPRRKMRRSAPPQSDSSLTHDHEHAGAAAPRTARPTLPAPRMRRPPRCTDDAPAPPVGLSRCLASALAKPADNTAGRASGIKFWRNKDPPRTICLPNPRSGGRYALRPMRDLLLPR
jgi:hypothetical protein